MFVPHVYTVPHDYTKEQMAVFDFDFEPVTSCSREPIEKKSRMILCVDVENLQDVRPVFLTTGRLEDGPLAKERYFGDHC
jgi:hypothetical protein